MNSKFKYSLAALTVLSSMAFSADTYQVKWENTQPEYSRNGSAYESFSRSWFEQIFKGGNAFTDNTVNIDLTAYTGTDYIAHMYGGYSANADEVSKNTVNFNGGKVTNLYGGYSKSGNVSNNEVYIKKDYTPYNGAYIYGGYSENGNVSNNNIFISADRTNTTKVNFIAGVSKNGSVENNTITITSNDISFYSLSGGGGATGSKGRTLNIGTSGSGVKNITGSAITGFDNINFYLPSNIQDGDTVLGVKSFPDNRVDISTANVTAYLDNASTLTDGVVHLINNTTGIIKLQNPLSATVNLGSLMSITGAIALSNDEMNLDLTLKSKPTWSSKDKIFNITI